MGLDGFEIIMAAEDSFGLDFSDEEISGVKSVGDFYDLVTRKLGEPQSTLCLTSSAFYRTRRAIIDVLGIARREIKPSTPLRGLLGRRRVFSTWRQLGRSLRLKLPELTIPIYVGLLILTLSLAVPAFALWLASTHAGPWVFVLFVPLWLGLLSALATLSKLFAGDLPRTAYTIGELAQDVLALNHRAIAGDAAVRSASEVWETICRLIVNQVGAERELITRQATFVEDLGIS